MQFASAKHRLRLAPHVRACESEGQVILLDLMNNQYLGINATTSRALAELVDGWPPCRQENMSGPTPQVIRSVTQQLALKGLLTDVAPAWRADLAVEAATATLNTDEVLADSTIGTLRLACFLKSVAVTAWWMRRRSLHWIADTVAARREAVKCPSPGSFEAMGQAAAAFERLRPFVVTSQERCLHNSLALVSFLASEGAFPRWVIGVKTCPFGAHSWVQSGTTVLNDQHEFVRRFKPILVV
jgi:hypothetical protein